MEQDRDWSPNSGVLFAEKQNLATGNVLLVFPSDALGVLIVCLCVTPNELWEDRAIDRKQGPIKRQQVEDDTWSTSKEPDKQPMDSRGLSRGTCGQTGRDGLERWGPVIGRLVNQRDS